MKVFIILHILFKIKIDSLFLLHTIKKVITTPCSFLYLALVILPFMVEFSLSFSDNSIFIHCY